LTNGAKISDGARRRRAKTGERNILHMFRQIEGTSLKYENTVMPQLSITIEQVLSEDRAKRTAANDDHIEGLPRGARKRFGKCIANPTTKRVAAEMCVF
jgi:hypothetical protein